MVMNNNFKMISSNGVEEPNVSSSSTAEVQPKIRMDMVNAAKQFMANPRVQQTPLEEQKDFLRKKGLTQAEIEAAFDGIEQMQSPLGVHVPGYSNNDNGGNKILDMAKTALAVGTAGFMFYRFVRSWLLPQLMGVPDPAEERMQQLEEKLGRMEDSNRAITETVAQTLATVTEQNEQIGRTLLLIQGQVHHKGIDSDRLLAELGILKSLLLNQNQFPSIPEAALTHPTLQNGGPSSTKTAKIPIWQLQSTENDEREGDDEDDLNRSNGSEV